MVNTDDHEIHTVYARTNPGDWWMLMMCFCPQRQCEKICEFVCLTKCNQCMSFTDKCLWALSGFLFLFELLSHCTNIHGLHSFINFIKCHERKWGPAKHHYRHKSGPHSRQAFSFSKSFHCILRKLQLVLTHRYFSTTIIWASAIKLQRRKYS